MAQKLTLEQRVERIESALIVQGIIPRDMPQQVPVVVPRVVARNVQWAPPIDGLQASAMATFDCDCVKKVHRQNLLLSQIRKRTGQIVSVRAECGAVLEVEIPKE
jgi:hypothetical protein